MSSNARPAFQCLMSDRLALVRDSELRDLIEQLDEALDTIVDAEPDNPEDLGITQNELWGIRDALAAAADFLVELRENRNHKR